MKEVKTMTYHSEKLGEYIVNTKFEDLPDKVVQQAKWSLLDAIGVGIGSWDTLWSRAVLNIARKMGGAPEATVWFHGDRLPDMNAALVNAQFVHSLDYNDDCGGIHMGAIMPPVAMAVGENLGSTGKEIITAVVLGYDIAARLASAMNSQDLYQIGYQPSGLLGSFAAAAVAGKLLNFNIEQIAYAFGVAGSYAGGTIEFLQDGTDTKRFHVAKGAYGGIMSAYLVKEGMNGPKGVFEGKYGILNVIPKKAFPDKLIEDLGSRYDILETSFKYYPACDGAFCPLEAAVAIIRENGLVLDEIEKMHFKVKSFLVDYLISYHGDSTRKYRPETEMDAQMSLPYTLAIGLLNDGKVRLSHYDRKYYSDPKIHEIADKVTCEGDPELDKVPFVPMTMPSIATITTKDGRTFTKRVDHQKGDPRNPFTEKEFIEKFSMNVEGKLSDEKRDRFIETINKLEAISNISELVQYAVK
jgi:2-methylcitrate dehydratase PrpD